MKRTFQPTAAGLRAAIEFWKKQDAATQAVLLRCKLDPVRWWRTADAALRASIDLAMSHGGPEDSQAGLLFAWEYRFATVIGGMDVLDWAKDRKFGELKTVRFVTLDDPWDKWHTMVLHSPESPWLRKWRCRDRLKKMLPKQYRPAVALARKSTFKEFRAAVVGGWVTHTERYQPALVIASLRQMAMEGRVRNLKIVDSEDGGIASWEALNTARERLIGLAEAIESIGITLHKFWRVCRGQDHLPESRQRVLFVD